MISIECVVVWEIGHVQPVREVVREIRQGTAASSGIMNEKKNFWELGTVTSQSNQFYNRTEPNRNLN